MSDPYRYEDELRDEIESLRERLAMIYGMVTAEPSSSSLSIEELKTRIARVSKPSDEAIAAATMTVEEFAEWKRNMVREAVANFEADCDSKDSRPR